MSGAVQAPQGGEFKLGVFLEGETQEPHISFLL